MWNSENTDRISSTGQERSCSQRGSHCTFKSPCKACNSYATSLHALLWKYEVKMRKLSVLLKGISGKKVDRGKESEEVFFFNCRCAYLLWSEFSSGLTVLTWSSLYSSVKFAELFLHVVMRTGRTDVEHTELMSLCAMGTTCLERAGMWGRHQMFQCFKCARLPKCSSLLVFSRSYCWRKADWPQP